MVQCSVIIMNQKCGRHSTYSDGKCLIHTSDDFIQCIGINNKNKRCKIKTKNGLCKHHNIYNNIMLYDPNKQIIIF